MPRGLTAPSPPSTPYSHNAPPPPPRAHIMPSSLLSHQAPPFIPLTLPLTPSAFHSTGLTVHVLFSHTI